MCMTYIVLVKILHAAGAQYNFRYSIPITCVSRNANLHLAMKLFSFLSVSGWLFFPQPVIVWLGFQAEAAEAGSRTYCVGGLSMNSARHIRHNGWGGMLATDTSTTLQHRKIPIRPDPTRGKVLPRWLYSFPSLCKVTINASHQIISLCTCRPSKPKIFVPLSSPWPFSIECLCRRFDSSPDTFRPLLSVCPSVPPSACPSVLPFCSCANYQSYGARAWAGLGHVACAKARLMPLNI